MNRPVLFSLTFAFLLLGACAQAPQDAAEPVKTKAPTECGEGLATVFSAADTDKSELGKFFRVFAAVPLPDGSIVLSYDPNTPEAGDESNPGSPRMVLFGSDGQLTDIALPVLDDLQVPPSALPLIAGVDGTLYVYDEAALRVIARGPTGEWRLVLPVDEGTVFLAPQAAISPDGSLYLALATQVIRVDDEGKTTTIAGSGARKVSDISFPEPPLVPLPQPATTAAMPLLSGLVVGDDGVAYVSTQTSVLELSVDGVLSLVADATANSREGEGIPIPEGPDPTARSVFTGLALSGDGSLLIADPGLERLLRISPSGSEVLLTDVSGISDGSVMGRAPTTDLLVFRGGGEIVCSYKS